MAKLLASHQSAKTAKKSQKVKKVSANEVEAQVAAAAAASNDAPAGSVVPGARVALAEGDNGGGGGGSAALPILGGLAVAGGVAAFALGGGEKNVAPTVAATQTVAGTEDTASTITVAATDANKKDVLTYTVSTPANGTATISNNVVTYTPKANFNGTDTFTVTVKDAKGLTATQAVTVNVAAVNDRPAFADAARTLSVNEDTAGTVTVAATDVDGDTLTYTAGTAANGTVTVSGGAVTYTPKANFNGTDSFVVTASDGKGGTATQTINVTVAAVNDAPTFAAATLATTTNEDTAKAITLGATDVDGDTLTYTAGAAANGTVTVSGSTATYTPKANYNGTDSFEVTVSDGKGGTAKQTVAVTVAAVDDAPVISAAATKAIAVNEDGSATFIIDATDIDTPASSLTASIVTAPANGRISVNSAGENVYTPNANFNGTDSFVVGVSDGTTRTTYTVNVTVAAVDETVSIDVTDDSTATTYSAAGDVYHFTDNSGQKTNAILTNMTSGDTVEVTGASSDYSFTSVGSDIQITYNNTTAGVLNVIVLKGLAGSTFISDEATAEAAAGWNFFNAATQPGGSGSSGTAGAGGNLDTDSDANALTQATVTAAGANSFTEDANVANYVKINGFGADDTITVSNALTSAYSFTSQGTDIRITYTTSAGVVNDITLVGVVSAGTFIGSEADAETALGRDFFKNAASSESSSSTSLDVGTASSTATVSGAGAAVTFTDDATRNSYVKITNFTSGDSIRVTNATEADYSFSSSDLDGDGSADDLSISYSNAGSGVVNDIQILNVVSSSAFVFDKATAVSAVGFNFITFG